jgi:hypothetical protein
MNLDYALLVISLWRAARVRESREPAPRMGRVSFVQTTQGRRLFPPFFAYPSSTYSSHLKGFRE